LVVQVTVEVPFRPGVTVRPEIDGPLAVVVEKVSGGFVIVGDVAAFVEASTDVTRK
jgi:hypothetical protein